MFLSFKSIFDSNEKQVNKLAKQIVEINALEQDLEKISDEDLKARTIALRAKLGVAAVPVRDHQKFPTKNDDSYKAKFTDMRTKLFAVMPEAFALVREASKRSIKHRHFDVQLMAGIVLAQGKIAELKTGEGKTIVSHLALYLYALMGRGAHLVTVNDYLARRDAEIAGQVFSALGLTVGVIQHGKSFRFVPDSELELVKGPEAVEERKNVSTNVFSSYHGTNLAECTKREAYACDIVYGTNNEFGFDYLRDNMTRRLDDISQGDLFFCIVDEVDSVLIDEARTPLIISAPAEQSNDLYTKFAGVVKQLSSMGDYDVDEKAHSATLTEAGIQKVEGILGVENLWEDYRLAHHLENALKAETLYKEGDEYLVKDGQVVIVDSFTGRLMPGRRFSEGLHQAIEAKEGVDIKEESLTLATISFQNLFRLYDVLSGMTGTAETEAEEFSKIYELDVVVIPTNRVVIRKDKNDLIYKNETAKFNAVTGEIKDRHEKGQPVLVGTRSVEMSEKLSLSLEKEGIPHKVLNAKYHEKEAAIISEAGQMGAVTIATNMAGRGTDIKLGDGVVERGGLYVIGTERHESRRIDNQLRGRSGRQGDPGESRFFIALDDEVMRLQGGEFLQKLFDRINVPEDLPVENPIITRQIEAAQKRVEGWHFDTRKHLVEYDDVLNQQRTIIYARRRKILENNVEHGGLTRVILDNLIDEVKRVVDTHFVVGRDDQIDEKKLQSDIADIIPDILFKRTAASLGKSYGDITDFMAKLDGAENIQKELLSIVEAAYELKKQDFGVDAPEVEKQIMMQTIDHLWMEHLEAIDDLRAGIGLRGYAQVDPLVVYKNEAFDLFDQMINAIDYEVAHRVLKIEKVGFTPAVSGQMQTNEDEITQSQKSIGKSPESNEQSGNKRTKKTEIRSERKVGRNDPCPCGSGKKYKKCCGKSL